MSSVGFTNQNCRFSLLNNSTQNLYDPYQTLRSLQSDGEEPYYILCHQDLLFTQATSYERLLSIVDELNKLDKFWAVAGDAGISPRGERLLHLDDPNGSHRTPGLPRKVTTLDENFLLVRRSNAAAVSPELSGFHFYGADLCLNCLVQGYTNYVIDFPVKHLSPGYDSPSYQSGREAMLRSWQEKLWVGLIHTTSTHFYVSSNVFLKRILDREWVRQWLMRMGWGIIPRRGIKRST